MAYHRRKSILSAQRRAMRKDVKAQIRTVRSATVAEKLGAEPEPKQTKAEDK